MLINISSYQLLEKKSIQKKEIRKTTESEHSSEQHSSLINWKTSPQTLHMIYETIIIQLKYFQ